MSIIMHDLAGADPELRFSPYCWRTRFALAHKGMPVETIPWRFTEKDAIAFSGQGRVPVIRDGDRVVFDSWSIAEYLEENLSDARSVRRPNRPGPCSVHQQLGRLRATGRHRALHRARSAGRDRPQGSCVFPHQPGNAVRHNAGTGPGGTRGPAGGVPRLAAADPPGVAQTVVVGRINAHLRRSHHRGNFDVATLCQPIFVTGGG